MCASPPSNRSSTTPSPRTANTTCARARSRWAGATTKITVIDIDQGQSGASAADREGFQHLVAEVSLGRAGIVLGLECSRLARNSADWHQLLELCGITGTLICDEDGLYDPRQFNDRLLLGVKGQMSEAELHFIKARLRGGVVSKARRGELQMPLPVGLVSDPSGHVVLDPDTAVQQALRHLFDTFTATGSATACVKAFRNTDLMFPWRHLKGPRKGELDWKPLRHHSVLRVLHNPRYAGAFAYGRCAQKPRPNGKSSSVKLPRDRWISFIPDAHPGYITLAQFEANQARLAANAAAHGRDRAAGPAREGAALLQGIIVCGRCGTRMTVRYHHRRGRPFPSYMCQRDGIEKAERICAAIPGADLDERISQLLLDTLTPLTVEAALAVANELHQRAADADRMRAAHVERARYHADLARRRYLAVDPANRLVADSLEADWNTALRELGDAQHAYQQACNNTPTSSPSSSAPESTSSSPTCPRSGTIPAPRRGNENASPGCCSPTSPCSAKVTPSPPTCGSPPVSTPPSPCPPPKPLPNNAKHPPKSSPPSTNCSIITSAAKSPRSSTSAASFRAREKRFTTR
jgi:DNA invertase Pin-like site-specific DNA recombinase